MISDCGKRIRRRGGATTATLVAVVALVLGVGVGPASADDPNWYLDVLGVPAAHAAGLDGAGVTIAVIDGQIDLTAPSLQGADITVLDPPKPCFDEAGAPLPTVAQDAPDENLHGTNVTSVLVGQGQPGSTTQVQGLVPRARILYIMQSGCNDEKGEPRLLGPALDLALKSGADIINLSLGDPNDDVSDDLRLRAMAAQVPMVAGVENPDTLLMSLLPGSSGFFGVGAVSAAGEPLMPRVDTMLVSAPGTDVAAALRSGLSTWAGSSAATPMVTGALVLAHEKWPGASMNQIMQLAVRTAGGAPATPELKPGIGYGLINLPAMLATDPSSEPDVSPLFFEGYIHPSPEEVAAAAHAATASPTPTTTSTAVATSPASVWTPILIGGIAAVVLLIVAGIIVAFVLVARNRKRTVE